MGIFEPLIWGARNGDNDKLEEIEYSYLYYLLTDESILLWGALGGIGQSEIDAIGTLTGMIIQTDEISSYLRIEEILGRLCAGVYLHQHYRALPPNR